MSFDQALALVLENEGGYTASTDDAGNWWVDSIGSHHLIGTNYGINAETLAAWRGGPITDRDMRGLTAEEAGRIYHARYWAPIQGDLLPPPIAGLLFDSAVQHGESTAARWLQMAVGVAVDSFIGPQTLAAVERVVARNDVPTLHAELARLRDDAYRFDGNFRTFGTGWIRRLMRVVAATAAFV